MGIWRGERDEERGRGGLGRARSIIDISRTYFIIDKFVIPGAIREAGPRLVNGKKQLTGSLRIASHQNITNNSDNNDINDFDHPDSCWLTQKGKAIQMGRTNPALQASARRGFHDIRWINTYVKAES